MKNVPIDQAKFNDLMAFAKAQQLDIARGLNTAGLVALIRAGKPGIETIEVEGDDAPEVEVISGDTGGPTSHYRDDPKVTVNIMSDDLSGRHHVPLSVNGDHILVQRDQDVTIAWRFFEVLKNAVEMEDRQVYDVVTMSFNIVTTPKKVMNYSVTRHPSDEEIEAWKLRTQDIGRGDDAILLQRRELRAA